MEFCSPGIIDGGVFWVVGRIPKRLTAVFVKDAQDAPGDSPIRRPQGRKAGEQEGISNGYWDGCCSKGSSGKG
jgi:hypothetical protein